LLAGIGVLFPFLALARRLAGDRAPLALFALAVSPLHLQASTTAASEALYLLLWVGALERLLAALETGRLRTYAAAGLLGSLAALTRYDAWLALPVTAGVALLVAREGRRRWGGLALFAACAALLPVAWLTWSGWKGGDPFFFAHYIKADHAELAALSQAKYGALLGRLRQVGIWTVSFLGAMTLPAFLLGARALARGWRPLTPAMRICLAAGLSPPAIYLAQGLALQSFEPLARFAIVPGALLLPLAVAALPERRVAWFRGAAFASAAAFAIVVWVIATAGRERIWAGAESMGALTRLDGEDRAVAAYLRAHRPPHAPVMIEPLAFAEIGIAHAAAVPWTESISLIVTRTPRATVQETMRATGARFVVGYDRPGGWPRTLPDWPREAVSFGRWRVAAR
jgi:4-amino-4-deoxy-L-arabinose transferase-like glycosyltransferase